MPEEGCRHGRQSAFRIAEFDLEGRTLIPYRYHRPFRAGRDGRSVVANDIRQDGHVIEFPEFYSGLVLAQEVENFDRHQIKVSRIFHFAKDSQDRDSGGVVRSRPRLLALSIGQHYAGPLRHPKDAYPATFSGAVSSGSNNCTGCPGMIVEIACL